MQKAWVEEMAGKQFSNCQIILTELDMTLIEVEVTLPDPVRLIRCAGNNNNSQQGNKSEEFVIR